MNGITVIFIVDVFYFLPFIFLTTHVQLYIKLSINLISISMSIH